MPIDVPRFEFACLVYGLLAGQVIDHKDVRLFAEFYGINHCPSPSTTASALSRHVALLRNSDTTNKYSTARHGSFGDKWRSICPYRSRSNRWKPGRSMTSRTARAGSIIPSMTASAASPSATATRSGLYYGSPSPGPYARHSCRPAGMACRQGSVEHRIFLVPTPLRPSLPSMSTRGLGVFHIGR